jgi:hypothetical protein
MMKRQTQIHTSSTSRAKSLRNFSGCGIIRERALPSKEPPSLNGSMCRKYTYSRQGKNAWLTILQLANRWGFPEVRQLAIRQLEDLQLQPVEKISTYKKYNVDNELLLPSYMALCRSPTLPSPSDGQVLTMETVLKLADARERSLLSAAASGCASPTSASASDEVLGSIVADLFGLTPRSNGATVGTGGQAVNGPDTQP